MSTHIQIDEVESASLRIDELLCEYVKNPLGIETTKPRLSWTLVSEKRGAAQLAYQVLVGDEVDSLKNNRGNIWDSGRVESSKSTNIECDISSTALSGKRYWWTVRVWDEGETASAYSQVAWWEMGLLNANDWEGEWIGGGNLLRGTFELENKKVLSGRVYVCGLGYYELYINGKKVGDQVLAPAWTDYEKRVLYDAYDVTEFLFPGENTVGLMLGKGRYPPAKEQDMNIAGYGPSKAILQMNVVYIDSQRERLFSSASWEASNGPVTAADIFVGEDYDARLEKPGWSRPDYKGADFRAVETVQGPKGKLFSSASLPPIRVVRNVLTKQILCPAPNVYVYDFGQNFSGWTRLRVQGQRGAVVTMRYAEIVTEEGNISTKTNERAESTDHYTLKGEGFEEYEPHFTYHGFRYVELTGFPGAPSTDTLEGRVVHSDVLTSGNFICSDALINRIQENIKWGQLSNLMGIPTDCPQRNERMGWLGDAQSSMEEAMFNFWLPGFYEKWLTDIGDTQDSEGSISAVAPAYWRRNPAEPSHGMAFIMIPFELYKKYGDVRVLSEHYESMKKYIMFLASKSNNYILDSFNKYGDYCEPSHISAVETSWDLVSTCMFYIETFAMSTIANVLGKQKDARDFTEIASKIAFSFNAKFLKQQWDRTHDFLLECYGDSQASNALPLGAGMVPSDKRKEVLESLVLNIVRHYDGHLDTGMVATKYLFPVLSGSGYVDLAYEIATKETYPGFGYMIREGATTVWERWEYRTTYILSSHNHIMLGSIGAWFYSALAGIQADEYSPGFQHFIIKPAIPKKLRSASASLSTIRGQVCSQWTVSSSSLSLNVVVPANTTCSVFIPTNSFRDVEVRESGCPLYSDERTADQLPTGVSSVTKTDDFIVCDVKSGAYSFVLTGSRIEN